MDDGVAIDIVDTGHDALLERSPRPILYPQHGWARRVLDLDPRLAPAGTVGQVPPL